LRTKNNNQTFHQINFLLPCDKKINQKQVFFHQINCVPLCSKKNKPIFSKRTSFILSNVIQTTLKSPTREHTSIRLTTRMRLKTMFTKNIKTTFFSQIKSTNAQTFSTLKNYVALIFPLHLGIRRSGIQQPSSTIIKN
jgi:hypothetical protein